MADLLHLVDKPEGWTSHDVVARMRRVLGERRVGHAGTLDPFATGLLIVAEGRATALLGCVGLLPKRYRARARLGIATDTQDRTGVPIRSSERMPDLESLDRALDRLRGIEIQRPPLFSAVKVRGERAYQAARRGESVEREERPVRVYDLALVEAAFPEIELDMTVSRGTYVRTLAHDLGEDLGCGAHLVALRRVAIGPFRVEDARVPDSDTGEEAPAFRARALEPADAVPHLPRVRLTHEETSRLRHGQSPAIDERRIDPAPRCHPLPPGEMRWPLALLTPEGDLLALAEPPAGVSGGVPVRLLRVLAGHDSR